MKFLEILGRVTQLIRLWLIWIQVFFLPMPVITTVLYLHSLDGAFAEVWTLFNSAFKFTALFRYFPLVFSYQSWY